MVGERSLCTQMLVRYMRPQMSPGESKQQVDSERAISSAQLAESWQSRALGEQLISPQLKSLALLGPRE